MALSSMKRFETAHLQQVARPGSALTIEHPAQLHFRLVQHATPLRRQAGAAAIDVEVQHGHGGLKRFRLALAACQRGALERKSDLPRTSPSEHAGFQVEGIAV